MRAKRRSPGAGDAEASGTSVPLKNDPETSASPESAQASDAEDAPRKRRRGALPARTVRLRTPWVYPLQVYDGRDHIGALDDRTGRDPPEPVILAYAVDTAGRWRALGGFPTRIAASRAIPLRPRHAEPMADGGSIRSFRSRVGR